MGVNDTRPVQTSFGDALRRATALTPWRRTIREAVYARGVAAAFAGAAAFGLSWTASGTAHATTNGVYVEGAGSIARSGARTDIRQSTASGVINWNSFTIGAGEIVQFHHNSASDITLNRVVGQDPSQIFGQLKANGRIVLVNPNGVFFRPGSRIDATGLIATTSDIDNADFMAGRLNFDIPSTAADARVVNEGAIRITEAGGFAILHGAGVENRGEIRAERGTVALGASDAFTVDLIGNGRVTFRGELARKADGAGDDGLVVNTGLIAANGGVVKLSALAVDGLLRTVINTTGVVQADTIGFDRGRVVMSAAGGGVVVGGQVAARGGSAGERGGDILVRGPKLELLESVFADASGEDGGGAITLSATEDLSLAGDVRADGGGGAVVAESQGTLRLSNRAPSVKDGSWTARAAAVDVGAGGEPVDGVSQIAAAAVSGALNAGTDVTIEASAGDLTIAGDVERTGGDGVVSLTLQAARDLIQDAETRIASTRGAIDVTGTAGRDVVLDDAAIVTQDGAATLVADNDVRLTNSTIEADAITLRADADRSGEADADPAASGGDAWLENATLLARGDAPGDAGGSVAVTGDRVALSLRSLIDASGQAGGGAVKVGGDYLGQGPTRTADAAAITADSAIYANALDVGDGGRVIVWSDELTIFSGEIEAKGGAVGGDGGFIETSSKVNLHAFGRSDAGAANGAAGVWLLDPVDVTIVAGAGAVGIEASGAPVQNIFTGNVSGAQIGVDAIEATLNGGTDVTILTSGASGVDPGEAGDVTFAADLDFAGGGGDVTLRVDADGAIRVDADINATGAANSLALDFNSDVNGDGGGGFTKDAGTTITTNGANIDIDAPTGSIVVEGVIDAGAGAVNFAATAGMINVGGAGGASITAEGGFSAVGGGPGVFVVRNSSITTNGQDIVLNSTAGSVVLGASTLTANNATIRLDSADRVLINDPGTITIDAGVGAVGQVVINAAGDMQMAATAGDVRIIAGGGARIDVTGDISVGDVSFTGGAVDFVTRGAVEHLAGRTLDTNGSDLTINAVAGGAIELEGAIVTGGGGITALAGDDLNITATGSIDATGGGGLVILNAIGGDVMMAAGASIVTGGGDVDLFTGGGGGAAGTAVTAGSIAVNGNGRVFLSAQTTTTTDTITLTGTGDFLATAGPGGMVTIGGDVLMGGGDVEIETDAATIDNQILTRGGDVQISGAFVPSNNAIMINALIDTDGGAVAIRSNESVTISATGAIDSSGGAGAVTLTASADGGNDDLAINGAITAGTGAITLTAGNNVSGANIAIDAAITTGGAVDLFADNLISSTTAGDIRAGTTLTLTDDRRGIAGAGDISIFRGDLVAGAGGAGDVTLAGNSFRIDGAVTTTGGDFSATSINQSVAITDTANVTVDGALEIEADASIRVNTTLTADTISLFADGDMSGAGALFVESNAVIGTGVTANVDLFGADIDVSAGAGWVQGVGALWIAATDPSATMNFGDGGAGGFAMTAAALTNAGDGFATVTLGSNAHTGAVTLEGSSSIGGGVVTIDGDSIFLAGDVAASTGDLVFADRVFLSGVAGATRNANATVGDVTFLADIYTDPASADMSLVSVAGQNVDATGVQIGGGGNTLNVSLTAQAGTINLAGATGNLADGDLTLFSGADLVAAASGINVGAGDIIIGSNGTVNLTGGALTTSGGAITIAGDDDGDGTGDVDLGAATLSITGGAGAATVLGQNIVLGAVDAGGTTGDVVVAARRTVTLSGVVDAVGGGSAVTVNAGVDGATGAMIAVNDAVRAGAGSITLNAHNGSITDGGAAGVLQAATINLTADEGIGAGGPALTIARAAAGLDIDLNLNTDLGGAGGGETNIAIDGDHDVTIASADLDAGQAVTIAHTAAAGGGDITVDDDVEGSTITLSAHDSIFGGGVISGMTVSLTADGELGAMATALSVQADTLNIDTTGGANMRDGDVRITLAGAGGAGDSEIAGLTLDANADINVNQTSGALTISDGATQGGNANFAAADALTVSAALTVSNFLELRADADDDGAESATISAALSADFITVSTGQPGPGGAGTGDIIVGAAVTGASAVSLDASATGAILNAAGGMVAGPTVGLSSASGIGNGTNAVSADADTLILMSDAAGAGAEIVNVTISGGATNITQSDFSATADITINHTTNDLTLSDSMQGADTVISSDGTLVVATGADLTATNSVALTADGDLEIDASVAAADIDLSADADATGATGGDLNLQANAVIGDATTTNLDLRGADIVRDPGASFAAAAAAATATVASSALAQAMTFGAAAANGSFFVGNDTVEALDAAFTTLQLGTTAHTGTLTVETNALDVAGDLDILTAAAGGGVVIDSVVTASAGIDIQGRTIRVNAAIDADGGDATFTGDTTTLAADIDANGNVVINSELWVSGARTITTDAGSGDSVIFGGPVGEAATGAGLTVDSDGAIDLSGQTFGVSDSDTFALTLNATNGAINLSGATILTDGADVRINAADGTNGDIVLGGGVLIDTTRAGAGGAVDLIAAADIADLAGGARLSSGAGAITLSATDRLTLDDGAVDIDTTTGNVSFTATNALSVNVAGGAIDTGAAAAANEGFVTISSTAGSIDMTGLTITTASATAGAGTVDVRASAGNQMITGGSAMADAGDVVYRAGADLDTSAAAIATNTGDITIESTGGAVTLSTAVSSATTTIIAGGGAITQTGGTIAGTTAVVLTADGGIGNATNAINIDSPSLTLQGGMNTTVVAVADTTGAGLLTLAAATNLTGLDDFSLTSTHGVALATGAGIAINATDAVSIIADSDNDDDGALALGDATVRQIANAAGVLTLQGESVVLDGAATVSVAGVVNLNATDNATGTVDITSGLGGAGGFTIRSDNDVSIGAALTGASLTVVAADDLTLAAGGDISAFAGGATLTAAGGPAINGNSPIADATGVLTIQGNANLAGGDLALSGRRVAIDSAIMLANATAQSLTASASADITTTAAIDVTGAIDLTSAADIATGGALTADTTINIDTGGAAGDDLGLGGDVTALGAITITSGGDMDLANGGSRRIKSTGATVTIDGGGTIVHNAAGARRLTIDGDGGVRLANAVMATSALNLDFDSAAGGIDTRGAVLTTAGGDVALNAGGAVDTSGGAITTANGDVTIRGDDIITLAAITTGDGDISATSTGNNITLNAALSAGTGRITLAATSATAANANVIAGGGSATAATVALAANGSIGNTTDALEIDASTLEIDKLTTAGVVNINQGAAALTLAAVDNEASVTNFTLTTAGDLTVEAGVLLTTGGAPLTVTTGGDLAFGVNTARLVAAGAVDVAVAGDLDFTTFGIADISSTAADVAVTADTVSNLGAGVPGGYIAANAGGGAASLTVDSGVVMTGLASNIIQADGGAVVISATNGALAFDGGADYTGASAADVTLSAQSVAFGGATDFVVAGDVEVTATSGAGLATFGGTGAVDATGDVDVTSAGAIAFNGGRAQAGGDVRLDAIGAISTNTAAIDVVAGDIFAIDGATGVGAATPLTFTAPNVVIADLMGAAAVNLDTTSAALTNLTFTGDDLIAATADSGGLNVAAVSSAGQLTLDADAGGGVTISAATTVAGDVSLVGDGGNVNVDAALTSTGGQIDLETQAGADVVINGDVSANRDLSATADGALTVASTRAAGITGERVSAAGAIGVTLGSAGNAATIQSTVGDVTVEATGAAADLIFANGAVTAEINAILSALDDLTVTGDVTGGDGGAGDVRLRADADANSIGLLVVAGTIVQTGGAENLTLQGSAINLSALPAAMIDGGLIVNATGGGVTLDGATAVGGDITITATAVANSDLSINAGGVLTAGANSDIIVNVSGAIIDVASDLEDDFVTTGTGEITLTAEGGVGGPGLNANDAIDIATDAGGQVNADTNGVAGAIAIYSDDNALEVGTIDTNGGALFLGANLTDIDINSDITVGMAVGGDLTLQTTNGNITQSNPAAVVTAFNLTLNAGGVGGIGANALSPIFTDVATLGVNASGGGDVWITEADAVTLRGIAASNMTADVTITAETIVVENGASVDGFNITLGDGNGTGRFEIANGEIGSDDTRNITIEAFDITIGDGVGMSDVVIRAGGGPGEINITADGNITAGRDVRIAGDTTTASDVNIIADREDAGGGALTLSANVTTGFDITLQGAGILASASSDVNATNNITVVASGSSIGDLEINGPLGSAATNTLTFRNNSTSAMSNLVVGGSADLTANNIVLEYSGAGGGDIRIDGGAFDATTGDIMIDTNTGGDILFNGGTFAAAGNLDVATSAAGGDIFINADTPTGNATTGLQGDFAVLSAAGNISFNNAVAVNEVGGSATFTATSAGSGVRIESGASVTFRDDNAIIDSATTVLVEDGGAMTVAAGATAVTTAVTIGAGGAMGGRLTVSGTGALTTAGDLQISDNSTLALDGAAFILDIGANDITLGDVDGDGDGARFVKTGAQNANASFTAANLIFDDNSEGAGGALGFTGDIELRADTALATGQTMDLDLDGDIIVTGANAQTTIDGGDIDTTGDVLIDAANFEIAGALSKSIAIGGDLTVTAAGTGANFQSDNRDIDVTAAGDVLIQGADFTLQGAGAAGVTRLAGATVTLDANNFQVLKPAAGAAAGLAATAGDVTFTPNATNATLASGGGLLVSATDSVVVNAAGFTANGDDVVFTGANGVTFDVGAAGAVVTAATDLNLTSDTAVTIAAAGVVLNGGGAAGDNVNLTADSIAISGANVRVGDGASAGVIIDADAGDIDITGDGVIVSADSFDIDANGSINLVGDGASIQGVNDSSITTAGAGAGDITIGTAITDATISTTGGRIDVELDGAGGLVLEGVGGAEITAGGVLDISDSGAASAIDINGDGALLSSGGATLVSIAGTTTIAGDGTANLIGVDVADTANATGFSASGVLTFNGAGDIDVTGDFALIDGEAVTFDGIGAVSITGDDALIIGGIAGGPTDDLDLRVDSFSATGDRAMILAPNGAVAIAADMAGGVVFNGADARIEADQGFGIRSAGAVTVLDATVTGGAASSITTTGADAITIGAAGVSDTTVSTTAGGLFITLNADGGLTVDGNGGTAVTAADVLSVTDGGADSTVALSQAGAALSGRSVAVTANAGVDLVAGAVIEARGDATTLTSGAGGVTNAGGAINAATNVQVTAASVAFSAGGAINAGGAARINTDQAAGVTLDGAGTAITAVGDIAITTTNLGGFDITNGALVDTTGGDITADIDGEFGAAGASSFNGSGATGAITVTAGRLDAALLGNGVAIMQNARRQTLNIDGGGADVLTGALTRLFDNTVADSILSIDATAGGAAGDLTINLDNSTFTNADQLSIIANDLTINDITAADSLNVIDADSVTLQAENDGVLSAVVNVRSTSAAASRSLRIAAFEDLTLNDDVRTDNLSRIQVLADSDVDRSGTLTRSAGVDIDADVATTTLQGQTFVFGAGGALDGTGDITVAATAELVIGAGPPPAGATSGGLTDHGNLDGATFGSLASGRFGDLTIQTISATDADNIIIEDINVAAGTAGNTITLEAGAGAGGTAIVSGDVRITSRINLVIDGDATFTEPGASPGATDTLIALTGGGDFKVTGDLTYDQNVFMEMGGGDVTFNTVRAANASRTFVIDGEADGLFNVRIPARVRAPLRTANRGRVFANDWNFGANGVLYVEGDQINVARTLVGGDLFLAATGGDPNGIRSIEVSDRAIAGLDVRTVRIYDSGFSASGLNSARLWGSVNGVGGDNAVAQVQADLQEGARFVINNCWKTGPGTKNCVTQLPLILPPDLLIPEGFDTFSTTPPDFTSDVVYDEEALNDWAEDIVQASPDSAALCELIQSVGDAELGALACDMLQIAANLESATSQPVPTDPFGGVDAVLVEDRVLFRRTPSAEETSLRDAARDYALPTFTLDQF